MANPEHVEVVQQGAEAIAEWRRQHPKERLDLKEADLAGADLSGADLSGAALSQADLLGADLSVANLSVANLSVANLSVANLLLANLSGANLSVANLSGADLSVANLLGANLTQANLTQANLAGANLTGAILLGTAITSCTLHGCMGLNTVKHTGPSSIGVDTLIESFRGAGNCLTPDLKSFFLGAGVPSELLAALPQILADVKYGSVFVCYGQPDLAFAQKLVADLESRGVPCWLYALDATPGARTWGQISRERQRAEKAIVLCSVPALTRDGVLKEIEEQIDEAPDKIVPVSLDNQWNQDSFRAMRTEKFVKIVHYLLDRNYADFSNESTYEAALEQLLRGLRRQA